MHELKMTKLFKTKLLVNRDEGHYIWGIQNIIHYITVDINEAFKTLPKIKYYFLHCMIEISVNIKVLTKV